MIEKKIVIKNKTGLHARPATILVKEATKYKCDITAVNKGKEANIKSLIGLLSLGACMGDEITFKTNGEDEKIALDNIEKIVNSFAD